MLCSIDDRIGKHSTNGLRKNAQQKMANIPIGGVEELLLPNVVLLPSTIEE
jgi:hypothetical protein